MTTVADTLPLDDTKAPPDQAALADVLADAYRSDTVVVPIGGGTSLNFGMPLERAAIGVSLGGLNRVVDYPARDMTITAEAGVPMATLAETLAAERQWLPIDVAQAETATLGGVVATAFSGPRRYGYGTMRDYVIGISAVDGRGTPFKAGGRVVKNVAGYDFCKLLTGSLGTLAVISQVTLKIKPRPTASAILLADLADLDTADKLLASIVDSAATPVAVELLAGPHWRDHPALGTLTAGATTRLAVGLEGTPPEVDWMARVLADEWRALGVTATRTIDAQAAATLWHDLAEFAQAGDAPLVLKASLLPSRTTEFVALVLDIDPEASVQAHAGNGIVVARFAKFDPGDVSQALIGRLQPAARLAGGHAVVLSTTMGGLTRQAIWGPVDEDVVWMQKVKAQFDPKGLLNPGRFPYAG